MAMKTIQAENLSQAYSSKNWEYTTWDAAYAGYAGGTLYGVFILRFDIPAFSGVSEGVDVGIVMTLGLGSEVSLRYAICTSDVNREAYRSTTEAVTDENQIASGILNFSGMTSTVVKKQFSIQTGKLKGGNTYYLILWAAGSTGISIKAASSGWGDHSVSMGYNLGAVRLKKKRYMVVVTLGGVVRRMIPYVKTATGAKPGG